MELGIISLTSQKPCHLEKVRQAEQRLGKNKDPSTTIQIHQSNFISRSDLGLPDSTRMDPLHHLHNLRISTIFLVISLMTIAT